MTCRMSSRVRLSQAAGALLAAGIAVSAAFGEEVGVAILVGALAIVLMVNAVTGACPTGWFEGTRRAGVAPNTLGFPERRQDLAQTDLVRRRANGRH